MRINLAQLGAHVKTSLASLYVITGDEPLLVEETHQYLRNCAQQAGYTERVCYDVDAKFQWSQLTAAAQERSLFDDKKIFDLTLTTGKPGREGAAALVQWIGTLHADLFVLLRLPKLDMAAQKSAWFTALEQHGVIVTIAPVTREQLPQWFARRLARHELQTDAAGLALLTDYFEGNLLAAKQAVERLALLYPQSTITLQQLTAALNDQSQFDMYGLLDAILQRHTTQVDKMIHALKADHTEPTLLIWLLQKELRLLARARLMLDRQESLEPLWQQERVWAKHQAPLRQHLRHFTHAQYEQLLKLVQRCDATLKGAVSGNVWDELIYLALVMSDPTLLTSAVVEYKIA